MTVAIFTYGSLMFEPVWTKVVSGRFVSAQARVEGFERHAIRDVTYPAAIPSVGGSILGRVYWPAWQSQDAAARETSLAADVAALDRFEDVDYERVAVDVELIEALAHWPAGARLSAWIYVFREPQRVLSEPWDVQWFSTTGIHEFMASYVKRRAM